MNIVKDAIKNNQIIALLEGKDNYKLENDSWASISSPTDWTKAIPLIYKEYIDTQDETIKEKYENAIGTMLLGTPEDTYCGIAVLYFQILRESSNRTPFYINKEHLLQLATKGIAKNEDGLKKLKKWVGINSENGLWDEVVRYKKLLSTRYHEL